MKAIFAVGDIVCYRAAFLRAICWYTDVPMNGKVTDATDPHFPHVLWCDSETAKPVAAANLLLYAERHKEPA